MLARWLRSMAVFAAGWAALLAAASAAGLAQIDLAEPAQARLLQSQLVMVRETPGPVPTTGWSPAQALAAAPQGQTVPVDATGRPYRSTDPHWALATLHNRSGESGWVLYYRLATLEDIQAHVRIGDGPWTALRPLHRHDGLLEGYRYPSFALDLPPGQVATLAARIQTRAPIRWPLVVEPAPDFHQAQRSGLVLSGIYVAMPLVVLLYLVLLLPRTVHLGIGWFIALIVLESVGALWVSGNGHIFFPQISREAWPYIGRVAYMGMIVVGWLHVGRFLGPDVVTGWVRRAGWALVGVLFASVVLELSGLANTRNLFSLGVLVFPAGVVALAIAGWRWGLPYAGVYALAWGAFVVAAAISGFGLLGWLSVTTWHLHYAQSSAAALLFGLVAVGHVREREKALAVARQEQLALSSENTRLEEALKARLEFFAATNHDLRQPLQALSIYLDLAQREMALGQPTERLQAYVADARVAYSSVSHFLDALLDLACLDAKLLVPRPEAVPLSALLAHLVREHQPLAGRVGLELRAVLPAASACTTDPRFLGRIVRNLLGNAIRHTREGGVLLAVRWRGRHWRLDVIDTGPGFSEAHRRHLYTAFDPAGGRESAGGEGLGLGLFIVRELAQALGLRLELSTRPGRGSRFSLYLPVAEVSPERPRTAASPGGMPLAGWRVGVLEDDAEVGRALVRMLHDLGAEVFLAETQDSLLQALRVGAPPSVLLADHRLREGALLSQHLDAIRALAGCPLVLLTGYSDVATQHRLGQHGFARVLVKPVQVDALLAALSSLRA